MTSNTKTPPIGAVLTAESDWIEWAGGENPVPGETVEVRTRGERDAGTFCKDPRLSGSFIWTRRSDGREQDGDIIAYRVVPSQAQEPSVPAGEGVLGQPVPDAFIAGFLHGIGRQPWEDMHDYAAVTALAYAKGEALSAAPVQADSTEGVGA